MSSSLGGGAAKSRADEMARRAPTWPRVAAVVAVLVLALFVSRSCQNDEIQLTEEEAVALAQDQVDFTSADTQVRLLRQGIERHPFWIVSLSIPSADGESYIDLAVVRIDATSGEVVELREQKDAKRGADQAP